MSSSHHFTIMSREQAKNNYRKVCRGGGGGGEREGLPQRGQEGERPCDFDGGICSNL